MVKFPASKLSRFTVNTCLICALLENYNNQMLTKVN